MKKPIINFIRILLFLFTTSYSDFTHATDYQSPRTASLGGAGRAGALLNDAIYLNPSYIAFLRTYSLSLGYQKYSGQNVQSSQGHEHGYYGRIMHVSLQDSRTELFKAGAGYTIRQNSKILNFGVAKDFFNNLSFGIGNKVLFANNQTFFDFSYSQTFLWEEWLQLSFVVDNLLQSTTGRAHHFYRNFNISSKFNIMSIMMIYLDPHYTPSLSSGDRLGFNGGIELLPFKDLFFRFGYFHSAPIAFHEGAYGDGIGLGAGWVGGRTSIDYGFIRSTKMQKNLPQAQAHTFSITLYF